MRTDGHVVWSEDITEQLRTRRSGEAPVVGCNLWLICDAADGRHSGKQHTAWLQDAMDVVNR